MFKPSFSFQEIYNEIIKQVQTFLRENILDVFCLFVLQIVPIWDCFYIQHENSFFLCEKKIQ